MSYDPRLVRMLLDPPADGAMPPVVPDLTKMGLGGAPAPAGGPSLALPGPTGPGLGPMAPAVDSAPAADPAHTPAELAPPDIPKPKGFFQRLLEGMYHVPDAVSSQLSPADVRAMRSRAMMAAGASMMTGTDNVLPALFKGLAGSQQMFGNDIADTLKQTAEANSLGTSEATRKADAEIAAKYPERPGETPSETMLRMTQMASEYAARGQPDRAKALAEAAKNLRGALGGGEKGFQKVHDTAGNYGIFNPMTGKFWFTPEEGWVTNHHDTGVDTSNAFRTRRLNQADLARVQNMNQFERRLYDKAGEEFMDDPQVKPVATLHNNFLTLQQAMQDALTNPAATGPLIAQLAGFAEPKARVQMQMLKYISNINPSYLAEFDRAVSKATTGKLPPGQLKDLKNLIDNMENASIEGVRAARKRFIKSKSSVVDPVLLEKMIPTAEDVFSPGSSGKNHAITAEDVKDPDEEN